MAHSGVSLPVRVWLLAALLVSGALAQSGKRPLNHNDYDGWKSIAGQQLSPDGKWLAYGLLPQPDRGESFSMPEKSAGYLAYRREPAETKPAGNQPETKQEVADIDQQRGGRGGRSGGAGGGGRANRPEFGTELVLRKLADSSEHSF